MSEELALAIQQVCEEKGLTPEDVKATIEDALAAAFRKDFGDKKTQNIRVEFELATGKFKVFDVKEVVENKLKEKYDKIKEEVDKLKDAGEEITPEIMDKITEKYADKRGSSRLPKRGSNADKKEDEKDKDKKTEQDDSPPSPRLRRTGSQETGANMEDEEKKFNPRTMISLKEAKEVKKSYKLGDEVITKLEVPAEFGRMAAQTAKQVIIQKLREAERDMVYNDYKDRMGELIIGTVQRQEGKVVLVDLGNTTSIVLPVDQVSTDKYLPGARMKFYIKSVEQTSRGPEILVSRSHPEVLRKLFKLEVPEINSGDVVIKTIARDAGARSKVAVMAKQEGLDPIGACIGQRGTRVQTIINELGGEKIDIIEWDEDVSKFITNALAPAKVLKIEIIEATDDGGVKTARAHVKEDQYSLAIGKGGQNVRLAAQLVGMKIDVVMEEEEEGKTQDSINNKQEKEDKKDKSEKRKVKSEKFKEEIKDIKDIEDIKEIKKEKKEDKKDKKSETKEIKDIKKEKDKYDKKK